MSEAVQLKREGHIAWLKLIRPDKRNVLDLESSRALAEAVAQAESDRNIKALVVASEGRAFCAGGSLDELLAAREEPALLHSIYEGFLAVANCPLPTLALVQGPAVGAGMNLALACDMRLASERALFDTRFMQLGIHSGGGHTWLLQQFMNYEQACAALLLGQSIDAEGAVAIGLALESLPEERLGGRAEELLAGLAEAPRELIEASKASLRRARAPEVDHSAMLAHEFEVQSQSLASEHAGQRLTELQARIRAGQGR